MPGRGQINGRELSFLGGEKEAEDDSCPALTLGVYPLPSFPCQSLLCAPHSSQESLGRENPTVSLPQSPSMPGDTYGDSKTHQDIIPPGPLVL